MCLNLIALQFKLTKAIDLNFERYPKFRINLEKLLHKLKILRRGI